MRRGHGLTAGGVVVWSMGACRSYVLLPGVMVASDLVTIAGGPPV